MSNKIKDIDIKKHTYYFFNDTINIKNVDPNNVKIDGKSYKNIVIYYIRYVTIKDSECVKINSVNPLYLIFNKVNGYFEEINKSKSLTLVSTNQSENLKKYEELWSKIRDLIKSLTKNSNDYDEKCMRIKFNSDDELPLNKTIEIPSMTIVFGAIFHENNKYYSQVFLDERPYLLLIIYKGYILKELMFLKELMLIRQRNQKNVIFATAGIF